MKKTGLISPGSDGLLGAEDLGKTVALLRAGEPVALPSETVYGLAANALEPEACAKIFSAKDRPFYDPLICHLPSPDFLGEFAFSCPLAERLAQAFWPGPLTMVLPKRAMIPDLVTAGLPDVALRCSAHPVFQQVVSACGFPLAAPSANRFGRVSPTAASHVLAELNGRIALVVDGGACGYGLESTIVRVAGEHLEVLRPGPILVEELEKYAPVLQPEDLRSAPGNLPSHYAPATPLSILEKDASPAFAAKREEGKRLGLLAWEGKSEGRWEKIEKLSETLDLREAGHRFYSALRELDAAGLDAICAEALPETGLGATIMQRLRKAAHHG